MGAWPIFKVTLPFYSIVLVTEGQCEWPWGDLHRTLTPTYVMESQTDTGTYPPLLVLFPCYNDHLSLDECELVVVVCLAVINGLHTPHFIFSLE